MHQKRTQTDCYLYAALYQLKQSSVNNGYKNRDKQPSKLTQNRRTIWNTDFASFFAFTKLEKLFINKNSEVSKASLKILKILPFFKDKFKI